MKNKTCGECKYHIGTRCNLPKETFIVMPEIEACRHFTQKPKMTNGDKIRQMSDEELAEFINSTDPHGYMCRYCVTENCKNQTCCAGVLAWLKQEAKENE